MPALLPPWPQLVFFTFRAADGRRWRGHRITVCGAGQCRVGSPVCNPLAEVPPRREPEIVEGDFETTDPPPCFTEGGLILTGPNGDLDIPGPLIITHVRRIVGWPRMREPDAPDSYICHFTSDVDRWRLCAMEQYLQNHPDVEYRIIPVPVYALEQMAALREEWLLLYGDPAAPEPQGVLTVPEDNIIGTIRAELGRRLGEMFEAHLLNPEDATPKEITPADLRALCDSLDEPPARLDSEGGFRAP